jgi:acyl CoA:acetate/3-ketoacid CoA transferase alpha subunit
MSGGRRAGAGRKPGGSNRVMRLRTQARENISRQMAEGHDLLDVAIEIAFNPNNPVMVRLEAAAVGLPYQHPRLSAQIVQQATMHLQGNNAAVERFLQGLERVHGKPLLEHDVSLEDLGLEEPAEVGE